MHLMPDMCLYPLFSTIKGYHLFDFDNGTIFFPLLLFLHSIKVMKQICQTFFQYCISQISKYITGLLKHPLTINFGILSDYLFTKGKYTKVWKCNVNIVKISNALLCFTSVTRHAVEILP